MIKFVNDLRHIVGFFRVLRFPQPTNLTIAIAEILLKVALNSITLTLLFCLVIVVICLRNKSWKAECVLSFNTGWRILASILSRAGGFHDLFRF